MIYKITVTGIIIIIGFYLTSFTQSLVTVKQDGTGDFTTIQEGVDFANNGDTVLVWPGTYFENVIIENKDVILGSLTLSTNDPAYISQTIINGNQTGSCVAIRYTNDTTTICGFSLMNGSGTENGDYPGGGLFIRYTNTIIQNCLIKNNKVSGGGGGMYIFESSVHLSGTTIKQNHSYKHGGGISFAKSTLEFDSTNLCSIYNNYAATGTDISKGLGDADLHMVLDTFTVLNPDSYYIHSYFGGIPPDDITWKINAEKNQTVNQNLYVSPDGNNNNAGTTPDAPLKDIWFAMLKLESDSIQPDTIHVLPGTYKMSTGERFPLSLKRYIVLGGESRESCILDAEDEIYHFHGIDYYSSYYCINNFTLIKGNGIKNIAHGFSSIYVRENAYPIFRDLNIKNNYSRQANFGIGNPDGIVISNCEIVDNLGGTGLNLSKGDPYGDYSPVQIYNCIIARNIPDYTMPSEDGYLGRGMSVWSQSSTIPIPMQFNIYNSLICDNHGRTHPYGANIYGSGLGISQSVGNIINCTIGNNTTDSQTGGCIGVSDNGIVNIYNSILYQNSPAEIYMFIGENELNIYNSLVAGGEEGINVYTPGTINYDPSNIDSNPMWDTSSMFPYSLSAGSPCINAGTLDLPPGVELPETDLAGNPRVYNGYVDMGAYEYGPWVGIQNSEYRIQDTELLKIYPNPFRFETNISYIKPENGKCIIRVYDLNGRCVKTLMDGKGMAGNGKMKWNGKNDSGHNLNAGTYIVAIIVNGKERDAVKVVKH